MGNLSKKFKDYEKIRQNFDRNDPIFGALKTGGNGQAGHNRRVANAPEWVMDDAAVRAVLASGLPEDGTLIRHSMNAPEGGHASLISISEQDTRPYMSRMILRHDDAEKSAVQPGSGRNNAKLRLKSEKMKKRKPDEARYGYSCSYIAGSSGLRTDSKLRNGKMGRPGKYNGSSSTL